MAYITGDEIRARLRTITAIEITDAELQKTPFIPAGDAWLDMALSGAGKEFDHLDEPEQVLARAAEIAFVAHKVISYAPVRGSKTGPVEIKPVNSDEKLVLCDLLQKEWKDYLVMIGCSTEPAWTVSQLGDGYYD